jgi:hypothetical protein
VRVAGEKKKGGSDEQRREVLFQGSRKHVYTHPQEGIRNDKIKGCVEAAWRAGAGWWWWPCAWKRQMREGSEA